ncbi:hypothetical protein [Nocardioides sp.]|uniref:hypothetical protein n=1 Tax=Nocardioides sp. TaxID=35761 RepID=UPI0027327EDF|nr:hypothetical protein [Nocardioides sp.]MDP3892696.1 hypothetical protein [Nocardioides sp.]
MKPVRRFGERLTYANVMATIAVVGMLTGGTAYAATKVGPQDIKRNAVLSKHIKNGQVSTGDLKAAGVTRAKLAPGVLGARAYVHVTRDGAGDFVVDTARTKNVVDVALPTTGNNDRPCLLLPTWINASTAVVIGTIDAANTPDSHTASVQHRVGGEGGQGCEGNAIALYLKRNGVGGTATISFNVMVP